MPTEPLAIPTSADIEQVADGVRILGAVRPADGSPEVSDEQDEDQAETGTSTDDDDRAVVGSETAAD